MMLIIDLPAAKAEKGKRTISRGRAGCLGVEQPPPSPRRPRHYGGGRARARRGSCVCTIPGVSVAANRSARDHRPECPRLLWIEWSTYPMPEEADIDNHLPNCKHYPHDGVWCEGSTIGEGYVAQCQRVVVASTAEGCRWPVIGWLLERGKVVIPARSRLAGAGRALPRPE